MLAARLLITYILEVGAAVNETQRLARHSTPMFTTNTHIRANHSRLTDLIEEVVERSRALLTSISNAAVLLTYCSREIQSVTTLDLVHPDRSLSCSHSVTDLSSNLTVPTSLVCGMNS